MTTAAAVRKELRLYGSQEKAAVLRRFFKTGPGQYAEGDKFIGVCVPDARRVAGKYRGISDKQLLLLLRSAVHEERLIALLIMVGRIDCADPADKKAIYSLYLENTRYINNWDLVDLSAPRIVGDFLADQDKKAIYRLAGSGCLWERRIAIVATYSFIRRGKFDDTLKLALMLFKDGEELIHKACGWMLREVGKRDEVRLTGFLDSHACHMPRTMLRYAIERFPRDKRDHYLSLGRIQKTCV